MTGLISVEQAVTLIRQHRFPSQPERVSINDALGRRLSAPIVAHVSRPPAAMSAMDGYAVQFANVQSAGARLKVIGDAPAGRPFSGTVRSGTAVRIFTGGVVPEGADHIVIQEHAERDGDDVIVTTGADTPRHIRDAGIDFQVDDIIVPAGTILEPAHLSVAAASNNAAVIVETRLRVGLLSNGDELKQPGSDLGPGEIINSNPYGIAGLIDRWGGEAIRLGVAADSLDSIQDHIDAANVDIIVPIGGASVGDHDHMHAAFSARGFEPIFQKVAVRPGKPTWFSCTETCLALGLPGNPASALVCAHLFLAPLLGEDWRSNLIPAKLVRSLEANGPREHFMRARLDIGDDGELTVDPAPSQDSSLLSTFVHHNVLIRRLAEEIAADSGADVRVLPIMPIL
ncbi:MAG: molybdopterin molybdotransferase MoeA [Pseudomonadota bacterium]